MKWYENWWSIPMWHWTHFVSAGLLLLALSILGLAEGRHQRKASAAPPTSTCCPCRESE